MPLSHDAPHPFHPCPVCGTLLLVRVWRQGTSDTPPAWHALPQGVTPVLGTPHACTGEAR